MSVNFPKPPIGSTVYLRDRFDVRYSDVRKSTGEYVGAGIITGVPNSAFSGGYRNGVKGKPITVNDRKWSPTRNYRINGWAMRFPKGSDRYEVAASKGTVIRTSVDSPGFGPAEFPDFRVFPPVGYPRGGWLDANTVARLKTELLNKIGKREVSYGESLAEAKQSVNFIVNTSRNLFRGLLAARKGNWYEAAHHWGVAPSGIRDGSSFTKGWLSYQYGLTPLLNDVRDTHRLLTAGFGLRPDFLMSAKRNLTFHGSTRDPISYPGWKSGSYEQLANAKAWYKVANSELDALNRLGLLNPVETLWAVQPYSFVVDWFLPIGNFLEAITARMLVDFVDGYLGHRVTSSSRCGSTFTSLNYKLMVAGFSIQTDTFSYERRKLTGLKPSLYIKSPFSTSHAISALALLAQLRRG